MAEKPPFTRMTKNEAERLASAIDALGLRAYTLAFHLDGEPDKGWGTVVEVDKDMVARDPMTGRYDWGPNWEYGFDLPEGAGLDAVARAVVEQKVTTEVWKRRHGRG